jgi:hypothetical protein
MTKPTEASNAMLAFLPVPGSSTKRSKKAVKDTYTVEKVPMAVYIHKIKPSSLAIEAKSKPP